MTAPGRTQPKLVLCSPDSRWVASLNSLPSHSSFEARNVPSDQIPLLPGVDAVYVGVMMASELASLPNIPELYQAAVVECREPGWPPFLLAGTRFRPEDP